MGFWHPDYGDKTVTDLEGLYSNQSPKPIQCHQCQTIFNSEEELKLHVFVEHPNPMPELKFRGKTVPDRLKIYDSPGDSDLELSQVDTIQHEGKEIDISALVDLIHERPNDLLSVYISNLASTQEITIQTMIADPDDLEGVEDVFINIVKEETLDPKVVSEFIEATRQFDSAITYSTGISEYLWGVLEKEGAVGISSDLSFIKKFNGALDRVTPYAETMKIAATISSLIHFNFNQFWKGYIDGHGQKVGQLSRMFAEQLSTVAPIAIPKETLTNNLDCALSDYETIRLLDILEGDAPPNELLSTLSDIEQNSRSSYDRTKAKIMTVRQLIIMEETPDIIIKTARTLRTDPSFGNWASSVTERFMESQND